MENQLLIIQVSGVLVQAGDKKVIRVFLCRLRLYVPGMLRLLKDR